MLLGVVAFPLLSFLKKNKYHLYLYRNELCYYFR